MIGIVGLKNASVGLSLNASFQYFGFAMGALLGALTLSVGGVGYLGWVGAVCALAALAVFNSRARAKPGLPAAVQLETP